VATYIQCWRGVTAVALAGIAGIFLPALTSTRRTPISEYVWLIGSVTLLVCLAASLSALFRKAAADRIFGVVAAVLTLWMIYAFYHAIS
jgi:hypothetical protein